MARIGLWNGDICDLDVDATVSAGGRGETELAAARQARADGLAGRALAGVPGNGGWAAVAFEEAR